MEIALLIFAVFVAYIVKGLCGFANTLVFTTIAGFAHNNVFLTPIELLLTFPSNIILVVKNRSRIEWKTALMLSVLVILGAIPGAFFLKGVDQSLLKIVFGVVVIIVGVEMFFRKADAKKQKQHPILMIGIGLISGVLCGLFGVGALLAAYVSRTTENMDSFKGTLNIVFIVDNVFRFIIYISSGILTFQSLQTFSWLFPIMLLALFIGIKLAKKTKEETVKKFVIVLLILSGLSLILTNIF